MNIPDPSEQQRLEIIVNNAAKFAQEVEMRGVKASEDIAKEKTQYFEKIALAGAGTIALVVSFVGAHPSRLQPPWLLRSALVMLFIAMTSAMYRNRKYHYYVTAVHTVQTLIALRDNERCRMDFFLAVPALSLKDGKPVDAAEFAATFRKNDKVFNEQIEKWAKQKTDVFKLVVRVEGVAIYLTATGIALLIALAWINF